MAEEAPVQVSHPADTREQQADQLASAALRGEVRGAARGDTRARRESVPGLVPGAGERLPEPLRRRFEAGLGHRLDRVRLHRGKDAEEFAGRLNASAYSIGDDVVLGAGHGDLSTPAGRDVLMHELAHNALGHGQDGTVMRKIATNSGTSLAPYLARRKKRAENAKRPGPSGNPVSGPLESITVDRPIDAEIFEAMEKSPRTFKVEGKTSEEVMLNLEAHVGARAGIVAFASEKKYSFGAGGAMKMNSDYWELRSSGGFHVKDGVDKMEAYNDVNVHPEKYAIACQMASRITMGAGSGDAVIVTDKGAPETDWVPGDQGYIRNIGFTPGETKVGLEGENIICTGGGKFWGHFTGKNVYRTLDEWKAEVERWNNFSIVEGERMRPKTGLAG